MSVIRHILTNNKNYKEMSKTISVVLLLSVFLMISGCAGITYNTNYKRWTYDLLRQEDCRQNDPETFCSRTFVFEYDEYEIVRQEFLRSSEEAGTSRNKYSAPGENPSIEKYSVY